MSFPLMPAMSGSDAASGPTLTFRQASSVTGSSSTYTFASRDIGPESADRIVAVCVMTDANSASAYSISGMTIGGSAATLAVSSSLGKNSAIFYLVVPTGTTADVVVTLTGAAGRCVIAVFTLTGGTSSTPQSVGSAYSDTNVASLSIPIQAPSDSAVISCCYIAASTTTTWNTSMIEVIDSVVASTTYAVAARSSFPWGVFQVEATPAVSAPMTMSFVAWR